MWFTEADAKHFKSGTLGTTTNITRSMVNWKKELFGTTLLKNGILWSCFSKILLMDFRIATNLKSGSSKKYSWKILFLDSRSSITKIIH